MFLQSKEKINYCFNCPLSDCVDPCPFGVTDSSNIDILKELNLYEAKCVADLELDGLDSKKRYFKIYYNNFKKKIIKRSSDYYFANKDSIKQKKHEYYLKNKEKISKRNKEYYLRNKEDILKRRHRYYCMTGN